MCVFAGAYAYSKQSNGMEGVVRFGRALYHGSRVVYDYKTSLKGLPFGKMGLAGGWDMVGDCMRGHCVLGVLCDGSG